MNTEREKWIAHKLGDDLGVINNKTGERLTVEEFVKRKARELEIEEKRKQFRIVED